MSINTIKTLKLTLNAVESVECQLTTAQLVDEPEGAETLTTFCGSEDVAGTPKYVLNISGFQDYGQAESVFDMLHTAYIAEPPAPIDFLLTVGTKTRAGEVNVANDPPFGGDAGAAMTADVTLNVVGEVTDGVVTPARRAVEEPSEPGDEDGAAKPKSYASKTEVAQAAVDAGYFATLEDADAWTKTQLLELWA